MSNIAALHVQHTFYYIFGRPVHYMKTTRNFLTRRFIEENTRRRIFPSLFYLEYGQL